MSTHGYTVPIPVTQVNKSILDKGQWLTNNKQKK